MKFEGVEIQRHYKNWKSSSQPPILKHLDLPELLEDLKLPVERRMQGATSGHTSPTAWQRIFEVKKCKNLGWDFLGFFILSKNLWDVFVFKKVW